MRNVYSYMRMIFQIPNDSFDKRYTIGSSIAEALAGTYRKKEALEYVKKLLIDVGLSVLHQELQEDSGMIKKYHP